MDHEQAPARQRGHAMMRGLRSLAAVSLAAGLLLTAGSPALAADGLEISTPYPSVALQPGSNSNFTIDLKTTEARTVDLAVSGVPEGWTATLRGGGFEVASVFSDSAEPAALQLGVKVPADAQQGTYRLIVTATSGDLSDRVEIEVEVATAAGGTVDLTSDFPTLRGDSDQSFSFNLQLHNDTPQDLTFSLDTVGPSGWQVQARPTSQSQAASFIVEAGSQSGVTVQVSPGANTDAGTYPVTVQAVSGSRTASLDLGVEITGSTDMALAALDQRLSTTATAGSGKQFQLVVYNRGTTSLTNVELSAVPPTNWKITFDAETIDQIAPGGDQTVTATITPTGEAIAGDYVVSFRASTSDATESIDVRVTVETSMQWAIVGIAIIVATLAGLFWVFQRYGRR